MRQTFSTRRAALLGSISILALAGGARAQDVDELIVTGTRREAILQEVPLNIAAVGAAELQRRGAADLAQIANTIPGVHLVDGGGRTSDRIIVRGLNADALNQTDSLGNNAGGLVSTYLGDIPIYIDLKLNDMERVEFLLGPQGTLYGEGTMAGAIRYIPTRPQFGQTTVSLRGDGYQYAKASSVSGEFGATVNLPLSDTFALRGSLDYTGDSGFIDYNYVVKTPGVSDPDIIDPSAPGYDLKQVTDANGESTVSGRLGLRWKPSDRFDANLTYYYQDQHSEGRTMSSARGLIPVGKYVSTARYEEPNDRKNELFALEMTADLGFAELTSATGYARFRETGQRDQTNLLITLEYSYETFPSFSAFTLEDQNDETITQEVRLVSKTEGPLSWLVGGFASRYKSNSYSKEFTPLFDRYVVDVWGAGGQYRPDSLEYYAAGSSKVEQLSGFGEATYQITPDWQVTGGLRYYSYKLVTNTATDFPLLYTSILGERGPDGVDLAFEEDGQKDSGFLYKFNTSYAFTPDALGYFTLSQGYRIGGGNGIAACPDPIGDFQNVCALPDEIDYSPDKTTNYELGLKTSWMGGRLILNGNVYYIKWSKPQLLSATVNGASPITKNGEGAETKGFEGSFTGRIAQGLTLRGTYAYTDAKLTADAPGIVSTIADPSEGAGFGTIQVPGLKGDRLPGHARHQASLGVTYETPVRDDLMLRFNYDVSGLSKIFSRIGNRGGALTLPGYSVSDASVTLSDTSGVWDVTLYAKNLFGKFAETAVAGTPRYNQTVSDDDGGTVYVRTFYTFPIAPRVIGIRFNRQFGF
ncbi:TonB-dependent receptor [Phenylobacterium immobile]|uniref:TonB-dependent receptor n=1 Tax=Phenylobacterium immobile TaxID=21 RepID=UPI000AE0AA11|nr:TonB-dependent receptor [Phenylobacterium immobile]